MDNKNSVKNYGEIQIPAHLPRKLSIACWIWSWISSATKGEPYYDLERCILESKERGFNTVRIEAGLNWAFTLDGKPRGQMEFGPWIAGYGWNFSTVNSVGGGRHDILERLVHLFELAKKTQYMDHPDQLGISGQFLVHCRSGNSFTGVLYSTRASFHASG
ncbi:MAG: cellulase-like family protein [Lentisphaerota bacterium]